MNCWFLFSCRNLPNLLTRIIFFLESLASTDSWNKPNTHSAYCQYHECAPLHSALSVPSSQLLLMEEFQVLSFHEHWDGQPIALLTPYPLFFFLIFAFFSKYLLTKYYNHSLHCTYTVQTPLRTPSRNSGSVLRSIQHGDSLNKGPLGVLLPLSNLEHLIPLFCCSLHSF